MNASEAVVRAPQPFEHIFHAAQIESDRIVGIADMLFVIDVTENVIQGILVLTHLKLRGIESEYFLL